jgi:hypothetical protein
MTTEHRPRANPLLPVLTFCSAAGLALIGYNSDSATNRLIGLSAAAIFAVIAVWTLWRMKPRAVR